MCKSELYRQILGTVSQETEISEERILSKAKNAEIVDARYLLVYFLWRQGFHAPVISSLMNFSRRLIDAINAAKQQSQSVVDSYEKHKANLEVFDQIMREVNPAYAGQAQRDKELQELRAEVGQLRQMQTEFASMKSSLDAFLKSQMSAKTSKS